MDATTIHDLDGKARTLNPREIEGIIKRIGILTGGISGWMDVKVRPASGWAADLGENKALYYDLGLAAALLGTRGGDRSITGVIAHEIGHLRESDDFASILPDDVDKRLCHDMLNLVEDKRIEILMSRVFPGMAEPIAGLRRAVQNPKVQEIMPKLAPHHQLLNSMYGVLFGGAATPNNRDAAEAMRSIAPMLEGMVAKWESMPADPEDPEYMTTADVLDELLNAGVYDTLADLRGKRDEPNTPEPQGEPGESGDDGGERTPGEGQPGEGGESGEGARGDQDADGESGGTQTGGGEAGGEGDDEGLGGDGEGQGAGDDDSDDDDATSGGSSGGAGTGDQAGADQDGGPTLGDLAALPKDQRDRLREGIEEALASGRLSEEDRKAAEAIKKALDDAEATVERVNEVVDGLLEAMNSGPDDLALEEDWDAYNALDRSGFEQSETLGRRFQSILRENARDRLSAIGYKSGTRIHERNLPFVGTGRTDVFRSRDRTRNRKWCVSIVCDVSASMRGNRRIDEAVKATVMAAEAIAKLEGVDLGVYMFGSRTACLKPLHLPMRERRGYLGALQHGTRTMGGSTYMAAAMHRVAGDMLRHTEGDPEVEHLMIVMTDGRPSDGVPNCKSLVTRLRDGRGVNNDRSATAAPVQVVGIGIQTDYVREVFPEWCKIDEPRELSGALTQTLRRKIRKAFV